MTTAPTAVEAVENKTHHLRPRRPVRKLLLFLLNQRRWFDLMSSHILKLNCPDAVGLLARVTAISG